MLNPPCFECQFLLRVVDTEDIRCKVFPSGIPDKILQAGDCIQFEPIAPRREHQDPEFHAYAAKLRRLHRQIIVSEELSAEEADLASVTLLAWAAGKFPKDWIRERKINAAEVEKLKNAGVWPW